ncbi:hypothetical protein PV963_37325 [Streptomyces coeruleorubidus]|uniref:hypothetical protein n=1 Tax=Streptomyces coeruleorubidus TaxID=116188 RepID=UPI00237F4375|nr:hypothetical protein [Streptomyces coeruleorubidus]WDV55615.1 hypothetical protein PV963_37325 [Streptomyces coeruleorubidus]
MRIRHTFATAAAGAALALGALTAPAQGAVTDAAADWSCSSIAGQYMNFEPDTPMHAKPLGSSQVYAYFSSPQWINGSCINKYGNQWWRAYYSGGYGYIYDGYRTG